jgi:hypothetical protein
MKLHQWRIIILVTTAATAAAAQSPIIARDGWEAFPNVEYQGGDATQPKKLSGWLVLTDSTIALYKCEWPGCVDIDDKKKPLFKGPPYLTIRLNELKQVASSSQVRPATGTEKFMIGFLATDHPEEFVGFVYQTPTSAEAPVFKTEKAQSGAVEAKVRFRLEKLGITLPPPPGRGG